MVLSVFGIIKEWMVIDVNVYLILLGEIVRVIKMF